ncbi:MAG: GspH/FimT family protein [Alcanivorax sp.]|nr:GspH/FimT family protein [Alcanivorax sp.]
MSHLLAQQRLAAATNAVMTLMQLARSESMTGGPVMLCDANHACQDFATTRHLILVRADPDNPVSPAPGPPLATLTLPHDTTVSWSRFRGNALIFRRSGILHFQNGHFQLCSGSTGRRIVMNWAGRPRVERAAGQGNCTE